MCTRSRRIESAISKEIITFDRSNAMKTDQLEQNEISALMEERTSYDSYYEFKYRHSSQKLCRPHMLTDQRYSSLQIIHSKISEG